MSIRVSLSMGMSMSMCVSIRIKNKSNKNKKRRKKRNTKSSSINIRFNIDDIKDSSSSRPRPHPRPQPQSRHCRPRHPVVNPSNFPQLQGLSSPCNRPTAHPRRRPRICCVSCPSPGVGACVGHLRYEAPTCARTHASTQSYTFLVAITGFVFKRLSPGGAASKKLRS